MKHPLGLVSVSFREHTPEEILKAMKETPLTCIEWGSDVHCPPQKAEEIAALQKQYGIECCSYGTYFRLGVTPMEELPQYIRAAKALGTDILRLWCGNKNSEDYSHAEKETLFALCRQAAETAEREGVLLCMECHIKTFTNRKEAALELMAAVDSPHFQMYWQPNQFHTEEENMEYAQAIAPYTKRIHIFNWKEKEKFPLAEGTETWQNYLTAFESQPLLLEFMPDGTIESLPAEAESLRKLI
ncbi:MAG: TIM barrel protein [Clostridia bacterium]|nr:TIM barrel protein [Clostridia bacterium]